MSEIVESNITNSYIEIHGKPDKTLLWDQTQGHFATLLIEVDDTPAITIEQLVVFSIDMSSSMSELCSDNKTKMQHIIQTTKNIIDVFCDNTNISIEIYGFDDTLKTVIERTKCTPETRNTIHDNISKKLFPCGSTNVGIALHNAKIQLSTFLQKKTHIFMTDGHVTTGESDCEILASIIDPSYENILIGFGEDHDAALLHSLAKNGKYYYINEIESAGLAYGEITHAIIYPAIKNITITINNGEIYNFQTNTWATTLDIPYLLGEAKKTYHLRTIDPDLLTAEISGITICDQATPVYEYVHTLPKLEGLITDLTKYLYRHRTLELLYESQITLKKTKYTQELCTKLNTFLTNMKEYIDTNNLNMDEFMSSLCDDIRSTLTMINTSKIKYAIAYSAGRAISNGTQSAYQPTLTRCERMDLDTYDLLPVLNRTNTSARQIKMMRDISQTRED